MVGWWKRMRVTTTRWSAALAWRLPPRFSLWRLVRPLDAGIGQAPHSLAKAPSDRMRSGLSPTSSSISAAVAVAMPRGRPEVGRGGGDQRSELLVVRLDLLVEREPASGDGLERRLRRRRRRDH